MPGTFVSCFSVSSARPLGPGADGPRWIRCPSTGFLCYLTLLGVESAEASDAAGGGGVGGDADLGSGPLTSEGGGTCSSLPLFSFIASIVFFDPVV